jgi:hypothetical protein
MNTNPKLRLQKGVDVQFSCHKYRKTLKLRNLKLKKKISITYMGFWLGGEKELQCMKILNQETLNWEATVCITMF